MGISDKSSIVLTELPDSAAVFDAATGIDYCCKGYLPNDPDKAVCIPSCTLYK